MARSLDIAYYLLDESIKRGKKNKKYYMDVPKLHRIMYLGQCFMNSMYQTNLFDEKVYVTDSEPYFGIFIDGLGYVPARCGFDKIKNIDKLKEGVTIFTPTYTKCKVCDLILDIYGKYTTFELIEITNNTHAYKKYNGKVVEIEQNLMIVTGQELFNQDDFDLGFVPRRRGYEMLDAHRIRTMLLEMTEDTKNNLKIILKHFGTLKFKDEDDQSLLHILVDNKYNESKCLLAIKSLLQAGLSPNLEADFNYNFIQTALYTGYSESFILNIIKESLNYNLNINHIDDDKDTIMHTAIYSDDYLGDVQQIYELLCANGYDSTKIDSEGRNLLEAMIYQKQYSNRQIELFYQSFKEQVKDKIKLNKLELPKNNIDEKTTTKDLSVNSQSEPIKNTKTITDEVIKQLETYGIILTNQKYVTSPTIGREKEFKNLIITLAQDKKVPIIVGESGVGKTALALEIAYQIQKGTVPKFLQGKTILEVTPTDLVAGCMYVGQFEKKITELIKLCIEHDIILFIDEIHTIYGVGTTKKQEHGLESMLKYHIDRSDIKVFGTTTKEEYQECFATDALKRRFERIIVLEPTEDVLYQIVNKVIDDYFIKTSIRFDNQEEKELVIKILLEATEKKHRVYNDMLNNPDLAISIIDKAYAYARVYDSRYITKDHFIESFENCDRIYESAREDAISKLRKPDNKEQKTIKRVLQLHPNG